MTTWEELGMAAAHQEACSRKYAVCGMIPLSDGTWAVFTPSREVLAAGVPADLALSLIKNFNFSAFDSAYEPRVIRPVRTPSTSPSSLEDLA